MRACACEILFGGLIVFGVRCVQQKAERRHFLKGANKISAPLSTLLIKNSKK